MYQPSINNCVDNSRLLIINSHLPDRRIKFLSNSQLSQTMQCCFTLFTRCCWKYYLIVISCFVTVPDNMFKFKFFQKFIENLTIKNKKVIEFFYSMLVNCMKNKLFPMEHQHWVCCRNSNSC